MLMPAVSLPIFVAVSRDLPRPRAGQMKRDLLDIAVEQRRVDPQGGREPFKEPDVPALADDAEFLPVHPGGLMKTVVEAGEHVLAIPAEAFDLLDDPLVARA